MEHLVQLQRARNRGQAALTAVMFFLFISVSLALGFSALALGETRNASIQLRAKKSYFVAEAGAEDVSYRILQNGALLYGTSESITLDNITAAVTVADVSEGKSVTSSAADIFGTTRKVKTVLGVGVNTGALYGAQVGYLGLSMKNSPEIHGSVFSNGNIWRVGNSGTPTIEKDAFVASSTSIDGSLKNLDTLVPSASPPLEYKLRTVSGQEDAGQSFIPAITGLPNKVLLYIKKTGTPGDLDVRIAEDNNGKPKTTHVANATLDKNDVKSYYTWVTITFVGSPGVLFENDTYWIVLNMPTGPDTSNYYTLGGDNAGFPGQFLYTQNWSSGSAVWNPPVDPPGAGDLAFQMYLGVFNPFIDSITVQEDAHAHTISNSTVSGVAYFMVDGSGNSFFGGTSNPIAPPTPLNPPFKKTYIDAWTANADAGGDCGIPNGCDSSGDYVHLENNGSHTLGSKRITGILRLGGNENVLTLTGNIHIVGTALFQNSCRVRIDPALGKKSVVIVVDGTIDVGNNCDFIGNDVDLDGELDNFVIFVSRSKALSEPAAVEIHNNVVGGFFYAERGVLSIRDNPAPNGVYGQGVSLLTNAQIDYVAGLANLDIVGSESVLGTSITSWREVE